MKTDKNTLFKGEQVSYALGQSFVKLNPRVLFRNPVMFTVEIGTVVMLIVSIYSLTGKDQGSFGYNFTIFLILLLTVLFANFAEAMAEASGKAQADSLRKTKTDALAKRVNASGKIEECAGSAVRTGDVVSCDAGDLIPGDGEVIDGIATVDESVITGE